MIANPSMFRLLLTPCLLAVCGCYGGAVSEEVPTNTTADFAAIVAQSRLFSQAYVEGDHPTQMGIYARDAVIAPPGRPFISGTSGLSDYWAPVEGREVVSHRTIPDSIVIVGDLAYDWGRYEGSSGPVGSPSDFSGKYLIVWRRDSDGVWRMVQDMWNAGPSQ